MDLKLVDLETLCANRGQLDGAKAFILEVDDAVTIQAYEVMMLIHLGVKAGGATGVADLVDHADTYEGLQDTIDRGPGYARNAVYDRFVDLIGCRVIIPLEDRLEDHPPLYSQGETLLTTECLKT